MLRHKRAGPRAADYVALGLQLFVGLRHRHAGDAILPGQAAAAQINP